MWSSCFQQVHIEYLEVMCSFVGQGLYLYCITSHLMHCFAGLSFVVLVVVCWNLMGVGLCPHEGEIEARVEGEKPSQDGKGLSEDINTSLAVD